MIKQFVGGVSGKKVSEAVAVSSVEHVGTAAARGGGSRPRRECDSGNPRGARVACENPGRVSLGACRSLGTPRVGRRAWRIIRGCF